MLNIKKKLKINIYFLVNKDIFNLFNLLLVMLFMFSVKMMVIKFLV